MGERVPKWVLCLVCGDLLYGGPGLHPVPRECPCGNTVVIPRRDRGYVKWNQDAYTQAGYNEPEVEWTEELLAPGVIPVEVRTIDDAAANAASQTFNPDGTIKR